jgi:hypothetical protein
MVRMQAADTWHEDAPGSITRAWGAEALGAWPESCATWAAGHLTLEPTTHMATEPGERVRRPEHLDLETARTTQENLGPDKDPLALGPNARPINHGSCL